MVPVLLSLAHTQTVPSKPAITQLYLDKAIANKNETKTNRNSNQKSLGLHVEATLCGPFTWPYLLVTYPPNLSSFSVPFSLSLTYLLQICLVS